MLPKVILDIIIEHVVFNTTSMCSLKKLHNVVKESTQSVYLSLYRVSGIWPRLISVIAIWYNALAAKGILQVIVI